MASASDDHALSTLLSSSPLALERAKDLLSQLRLSTGPGSANELDSFCTLALPAVAALLACKAFVPLLSSWSATRPESLTLGPP